MRRKRSKRRCADTDRFFSPSVTGFAAALRMEGMCFPISAPRGLFAITLCLTAPLAAQTIWLQVSTATTPPGRAGAAMAHDYLRDRIVLYGGQSQSSSFYDTWSSTAATGRGVTP